VERFSGYFRFRMHERLIANKQHLLLWHIFRKTCSALRLHNCSRTICPDDKRTPLLTSYRVSAGRRVRVRYRTFPAGRSKVALPKGAVECGRNIAQSERAHSWAWYAYPVTESNMPCSSIWIKQNLHHRYSLLSDAAQSLPKKFGVLWSIQQLCTKQ